jgi:hypothetical protein
VGNAHRDSQNVNLLALLLEYGVQRGVQRIDSEGTLAFCVLVNLRRSRQLLSNRLRIRPHEARRERNEYVI